MLIRSMLPIPTSWSILILYPHVRVGHPSGLFPSGLPTKTLYAPLLSPIRDTCPVHLILLDFIIRIIFSEEYRLWSSSLRSPSLRICSRYLWEVRGFHIFALYLILHLNSIPISEWILGSSESVTPTMFRFQWGVINPKVIPSLKTSCSAFEAFF
jgi:hypothetical protein